jgi:hypothetical protein
MPAPQGHSITYTGNRADGDSTNIYGNVYGDVHLPERPREADELSPHQCLRDLRVTDPRDDRARIEGDKDSLLRDCYAWVLDDDSFQQWKTQDASRLLWIKGGPGKGKTMMTMGVIAELSRKDEVRSSPRTMSKTSARTRLKAKLDARRALRPHLLAYFFCQSTRPELNTAVSVLRGLIYLLIEQRQDMMRHLQKRYETVGKRLFEGPNVVYALRGILSDMLNDDSLPPTCLLIDALDECTSGLPELLQVINDTSLGPGSRVKWLVTSRNIPEIERYLRQDSLGVKVSLEVKASHVSRAVAAFVEYKVQRLATMRKYDTRLQAEVEQHLRDKAEDTFLWVSLVCKELEKVPRWCTREVLQALPPGLDPLYDRMMAQIVAQESRTVGYCKDILRVITLAFRPLQLRELAIAAGLPQDHFSGVEAVADLASHCGSFLTVRQDTVSFIHLSAKDYLTLGNGQQMFGGAVAKEQERVTLRLLKAMDDTLRRDLCGLENPGARIEGMTEQIEESVLPQIAYACEYWVDHLCASNLTSSVTSEDILRDGGVVDLFLQKKFLYWLEALSLCKSMPKGVVAVGKLWSLMQVSF